MVSAASLANEAVLYTAMYMPSLRTQIYLTADQRRRLDSRGRRTGTPLAAMIREAVDAYLVEDAPSLDVALGESFGAIPDLELIPRGEWNRGDDGADPGR